MRYADGRIEISIAECLERYPALELRKRELRLRLSPKFKRIGPSAFNDRTCLWTFNDTPDLRARLAEELSKLDALVGKIANRDLTPKMVEGALGITNRERLRWTKEGRLRRVNAAPIRGRKVNVTLYSARQISELAKRKSVIEAWRREDNVEGGNSKPQRHRSHDLDQRSRSFAPREFSCYTPSPFSERNGNMTGWLQDDIALPDAVAADAARAHQSRLTKPPGSLGRMEEVAVFMAACQGCATPDVSMPHILVFAADHGIVEEGVSAFPAEVTTQMILNFVAGGAAISVLARETGAALAVVDVGSHARELPDGVTVDKIAHGSANMRHAAALTEQELEHALGAGRRAVLRAVDAGADFLIFGEMGIGNTSAASAVAAALSGRDVSEICGPGTGLSTDKVRHKAAVLKQAIDRHQISTGGAPLDILARVGGHEVAALTGAFVAAAQAGCPVLVDGFIASVAALAAIRINPAARDWMIFAHVSAEPGHRLVLDEIGADPLLDLGMRLGEGSGAAVALPLVRLACRLHSQMATFDSAGVSEGGAG